jgi:sugar phosphate isomerase/epimerase
MLQVGIFTAYFPYGLEETARKIREHGFNTVQLDLSFKDMDLSDENIDSANCRRIRETFRRYDLAICAVSGYTNLVHPDPGRRKQNHRRLKQIIRHARELGTPYVVSETGTFDADSDWVHHPKNKTKEGYAECRDAIGQMVQCASDHGAVFCIETYVNNVIGSVEETLKLFSQIPDPCLGLLMDPTNYFEDHNIDKMDETLDHIFDALSDDIKIAHAKDVKRADGDKGVQMADIDASEGHALRGVGKIELPPPGLGSLNYDLYLQRLSREHPNIPIVIEHLDEADVPRAKKFLDEKLMAVGC